MERAKNFLKYNPYRFLAVIYLVGIFGHLLAKTRPLMFILTTPVLLITGFIVLYESVLKKKDNKSLIFILLSALITFCIEVIGVATGSIFGEYVYGSVLGYKLFGVPIIISFNWVMVLIGANSIAHKSSSSFLLRVFITAALAVLFDYIMEPVAVSFGYWRWSMMPIPIQNYVAWGLTAGVYALCSEYFAKNTISKLAAYYYFVQFVYFLILNMISKHIV
ncbi:MAG: carotenoid biosynthesis protein [Pseudomonadota bacterium]